MPASRKPERSVAQGVDYAALGREVESVLVKDYVELLHNTRRQIWSSFVRGVFVGLGSVIGATVVVAVLIWLLHTLGGVPVIGQYLQGAGQVIQKR